MRQGLIIIPLLDCFIFIFGKVVEKKRANFIFILGTREKEINNIYRFVNESSINKFY